MSGVIHVITQLERGGAQRNTLETAAGLHHPGRPQLLLSGEPGPLDDEARQRLGPRFIHVPHLLRDPAPLSDARALAGLTHQLRALIERLRPPVVVHTHSTKAGVLGRLAARAVPGTITVHTVHGFGFDALAARRRWLIESAERLAAPATDVAIFVSDADRREADRMRLFPGARQETIRSGIDSDAFVSADDAARSAARAQFNLRSDDVVAVTVANLKQQKDPLFHIDVLTAWRSNDPRARLLYVGDGPLRSAVEERARQRGVSDGLLLAGFLDDPRPAYAAADVFLLASRWEGLPRAVLEANAAGLHAVVRHAGWADDLSWMKTLTSLPAEAPSADVAAALARAVAATRAGKRATKTPRGFTLRGMLGDLERLYDELIGVPGPSAAEREQMLNRRRRLHRR